MVEEMSDKTPQANKAHVDQINVRTVAMHASQMGYANEDTFVGDFTFHTSAKDGVLRIEDEAGYVVAAYAKGCWAEVWSS